MKYEYEFEDRFLARLRCECNFAIVGAVVTAVTYVGTLIAGSAAAVGSAAAATAASAAAASAAAAGGVAGGLAAIGVGEATAAALGTALVGAGTGAALGAGEAAIMGGDPGKGALGGAISGGVLAGAGGALGSALGSATAGNVLAGAAGGTLAAGATGGNLATGALTGAGSGFLQSAIAGDLTGGGTAPPNAAGPVQPGTGVPGVESVTVHAPGTAPLTPTLAGVSNKAPTAADRNAGTGTESVTVHAPTAAGGSALTPTGAGALTAKAPGSNLDSKFSSIYGAPGPGVTGTAGQSNVGNTSGAGTESVTVSGLAQPKVGSIAPTAAGLSTATGTATPAADPATGDDKDKNKTYLEKLQGKTEDMLSNPVTLLAGGALLADATGMFNGGNAAGELSGGADKQAAALTNTATQSAVEAERLRSLGNQDILKGQDLQNYLQTGTLPPGMQAQLNAARESAKAGTRQMYSNMGMGEGNTSLYQDLANIDMAAAASSSSLATQLFDSGTNMQTTGNSLITSALSYTNAGTDIYKGLLEANMKSDENLSKSVTSFVDALAKMGQRSTVI